MKIQIEADGEIVDGSCEEIVEAMKCRAFGREHYSDQEYMDWAAKAAKNLLGKDLNTSSIEAFVQSMAFSGLIKILENSVRN